jgi:hypothetical protein
LITRLPLFPIPYFDAITLVHYQDKRLELLEWMMSNRRHETTVCTCID